MVGYQTMCNHRSHGLFHIYRVHCKVEYHNGFRNYYTCTPPFWLAYLFLYPRCTAVLEKQTLWKVQVCSVKKKWTPKSSNDLYHLPDLSATQCIFDCCICLGNACPGIMCIYSTVVSKVSNLWTLNEPALCVHNACVNLYKSDYVDQ